MGHREALISTSWQHEEEVGIPTAQAAHCTHILTRPGRNILWFNFAPTELETRAGGALAPKALAQERHTKESPEQFLLLTS
jgi:hypothetical protein